MLIVSPQIKVYASLQPTDMRKSFDGLTGIIETQLGQQIEGGDLFLFFNRRRDRLKVLYFTGDGTVILYKRLERGTFEPLRGASAEQGQLTLRTEELALLLDGVELSSVRRRNWWRAESSQEFADNSATVS
jgi:transposase